MSKFVDSKARETQYKNVSDEQMADKNIQATLIKHSYLARGFSEEEATEQVKIFADLGEDKLKEKAVNAKKFLVAREQEERTKLLEEAEASKKANEAAREESLKDIKKFVDSQAEVISGLPITDKTKTELYKDMTTAVSKDKSGNPQNVVGMTRSKDPVRFDFLLAYYHKLGFFNEKPNFDKIKKMAESKTAKGLDEMLKEGTTFLESGKAQTAVRDNEDDTDLGLDIF